jgi:hypothetical protein
MLVQQLSKIKPKITIFAPHKMIPGIPASHDAE